MEEEGGGGGPERAQKAWICSFNLKLNGRFSFSGFFPFVPHALNCLLLLGIGTKLQVLLLLFSFIVICMLACLYKYILCVIFFLPLLSGNLFFLF